MAFVGAGSLLTYSLDRWSSTLLKISLAAWKENMHMALMVPGCAGEQPALTPRKLTLCNTTIQSVIQDISFQTSILAVRLNRKRYSCLLISEVVNASCLQGEQVAFHVLHN